MPEPDHTPTAAFAEVERVRHAVDVEGRRWFVRYAAVNAAALTVLAALLALAAADVVPSPADGVLFWAVWAVLTVGVGIAERRRRVLAPALARLSWYAVLATFGILLALIAIRAIVEGDGVAVATAGIVLVPSPWLVALLRATRR